MSMTSKTNSRGRLHVDDSNNNVAVQQHARQHQSTSRYGRSRYFFQFIALLFCVVGFHPASSQTVGVDICACQPSTYEFLLDFNLICENSTVGGPGINASACTITTDRNLNVTDLKPAVVGKIQVLELNQNLDIISETPYEGEYFDGDIFTYTSVIAGDTITRPEDVPRALQMTITGRNSNEEDLVNFWIIIFDNSCGIYPVVLEGEQIGWTTFNGLNSPPVDICPLAPSGEPSTFAPSLPPLPPESSPRPSFRPTPPPPPRIPSCPPIGKGKGKGSSLLPKKKVDPSKKSHKAKISSKHSSKTSSKHSSQSSKHTSQSSKHSSQSSKHSSKGKGSSKNQHKSSAKGHYNSSDSSSKGSTKKKFYYPQHLMKKSLSSPGGSSGVSLLMAMYPTHSPPSSYPIACPEEYPITGQTVPPYNSSKKKGKGGVLSNKSSKLKSISKSKSEKGKGKGKGSYSSKSLSKIKKSTKSKTSKNKSSKEISYKSGKGKGSPGTPLPLPPPGKGKGTDSGWSQPSSSKHAVEPTTADDGQNPLPSSKTSTHNVFDKEHHAGLKNGIA